MKAYAIRWSARAWAEWRRSVRARLALPQDSQASDLVEFAQRVLDAQTMFSDDASVASRRTYWSKVLADGVDGTLDQSLPMLAAAALDEAPVGAEIDAYAEVFQPYISRAVCGRLGIDERERCQIYPYIVRYVRFLDGLAEREPRLRRVRPEPLIVVGQLEGVMMNDLERLDFHVGPQLQALGGILDRLDYGRLRRLGVVLRNIPRPGDDWDIPPSSLQGWIASYGATIDTVAITQHSGLLGLMKEASNQIRAAASVEALPALDEQLVEKKTLGELVDYVKAEDRFAKFDFERFSSSAPSQEELARALVVQINVSTSWQERTRVDKGTGLRRLQVGALIGKAATGGALAVANLSLGVLGGLSVVPSLALTSIPIAAGLVTSAYTGLAAAFDAVEKIATALRG